MYGIWSCAACGATACATPLESSPNNPWTLSSSTRLRICWDRRIGARLGVSDGHLHVASVDAAVVVDLRLGHFEARSAASPYSEANPRECTSPPAVERRRRRSRPSSRPTRRSHRRRRPAGIVADRPASGFRIRLDISGFGFACFLHPDLQLPLLTIIRECPPYINIQVNHMHRSVFEWGPAAARCVTAAPPGRHRLVGASPDRLKSTCANQPLVGCYRPNGW